MSRTPRIETRDGRRKLPARREPYWRGCGKGVAIGYSKQKSGATSWYLRKFTPRPKEDGGDIYAKRRLGETDDEYPADGQLRLSWNDALRLVLDESKHVKLRYTVREAVESYFRSRAARSQSARSTADDQDRLQAFVAKFGDAYLSDLTTAELQTWRDSLVAFPDPKATDTANKETQRRSRATVNRMWSICRAALNAAFITGRTDSDIAWRRIKPFSKVDRAKTRFLSVVEAEKLLANSRDDFRPLAHAALTTGMRLGELLSLTAGDVNTTFINVPPGKTGRDRAVPLASAEAQEMFAKLIEGKKRTDPLFLAEDGTPWIRMQVSRRMKSASKKAKLDPSATFHDLRRTVGSWLANAGVQDSVIADVLGHLDTRMTRRHYAHLLNKTVAEQMAAHLPRLGGKAAPKKRRPTK